MSTAQLRVQLSNALGERSTVYFDTLNDFLCGKLARHEFDELVREYLKTHRLVYLHNSILIRILDTASNTSAPSSGGDGGQPARKRRRTLPYQGPDDPYTLRSTRLTQWIIGVGRKERERFKELATQASGAEELPRPERDEIAHERGVRLLPEGRNEPGTHVPVQLCSISRAIYPQAISDRIALISAQNGLKPPQNKQVSSLLVLACEAKLKQLITHAITLTSTSNSIATISSRTQTNWTPVLSTAAFNTLFALVPSVLPQGSAAAVRLRTEDPNGDLNEDDVWAGTERHTEDGRWQMLALMSERSAVRDMMKRKRPS